jgi:hypothetical protein
MVRSSTVLVERAGDAIGAINAAPPLRRQTQ